MILLKKADLSRIEGRCLRRPVIGRQHSYSVPRGRHKRLSSSYSPKYAFLNKNLSLIKNLLALAA